VLLVPTLLKLQQVLLLSVLPALLVTLVTALWMARALSVMVLRQLNRVLKLSTALQALKLPLLPVKRDTSAQLALLPKFHAHQVTLVTAPAILTQPKLLAPMANTAPVDPQRHLPLIAPQVCTAQVAPDTTSPVPLVLTTLTLLRVL